MLFLRGRALLRPTSRRILWRCIIILKPIRVVLKHNGLEQLVLLRIGYLAVAVLWDGVLLVKLDAPIEIQL